MIVSGHGSAKSIRCSFISSIDLIRVGGVSDEHVFVKNCTSVRHLASSQRWALSGLRRRTFRSLARHNFEALALSLVTSGSMFATKMLSCCENNVQDLNNIFSTISIKNMFKISNKVRVLNRCSKYSFSWDRRTRQ